MIDRSEPSNTVKITLLIVLYALQALPMGISAALPILLKARGASYGDIATFSLATLPFSLKVLWAPIVDATRRKPFGRRKSWFVPVQLTCAFLMLAGGITKLPSFWAGELDGSIEIYPLTAYYAALYFLMATQDIAVDGWAVEMFSDDMKKHASTCNTIGQNIGFYSTNIMFLMFNPVRDTKGLDLYIPDWVVSQSDLLFNAGIIMIVSTLVSVVCLTEHDSPIASIGSSYRMIISSLSLPNIRRCIVFLMTIRVGHAFIENMFWLKCTEAGLNPNVIAVASLISGLTSLLTSAMYAGIIDNYLSTMALLRLCYCIKTAMVGLMVIAYIWMIKLGINTGFGIALFILTCVLVSIPSDGIFVSQMAFFAKVSDVAIGGSYMTLLNTMANLGSRWPSFVILKGVNYLPFDSDFTMKMLGVTSVTVATLWFVLYGDRTMKYLNSMSLKSWSVQLEYSPLEPCKSVD